jgi:glutaminase
MLPATNVVYPGAVHHDDVQQAVDAAYAKFRTLEEGRNADYIPALADSEPRLFGIAVVTADRTVHTAGDATGARFNSIIAVEAIRTVVSGPRPTRRGTRSSASIAPQRDVGLA